MNKLVPVWRVRKCGSQFTIMKCTYYYSNFLTKYQLRTNVLYKFGLFQFTSVKFETLISWRIFSRNHQDKQRKKKISTLDPSNISILTAQLLFVFPSLTLIMLFKISDTEPRSSFNLPEISLRNSQGWKVHPYLSDAGTRQKSHFTPPSSSYFAVPFPILAITAS